MRINVNNVGKISAALQAVNGKAVAHTACSYDVQAMAVQAEKTLENANFPVANRKGTVFVMASGSKLPNSYKYRVIRTYVTLERGAKDWFMTDAICDDCYPSQAPKGVLTVSKGQMDAAVERLQGRYGITVEDQG